MRDGLPIKKMVNFSGVWEVLLQIRSPAMMDATRILDASNWHPKEERTWFR